MGRECEKVIERYGERMRESDREIGERLRERCMRFNFTIPCTENFRQFKDFIPI